MSGETKLNAMERAAAALRSIPRKSVYDGIPTDEEWSLNYARAAILAYLEALAEDEGQDAPGTVEQCMKAVLKSWKHAGVTCSPDLEASELAARAVLRTLIQRAQGDAK